ncbi:MAG: crossover junction endodeoxyribonuclease RuvC [Oscillospiraceae bacterium]|nr:crossover junction endodeoxyribonuclease RuvC [Oscillospiraceae bacterium]
MRILGIDPGYAIVGYGVLDYDGRNFAVKGYGAITTTPDMQFDERLGVIYNDMNELLDMYKPEAISLEKLFFNTNHTTAIDVAQARGVILLSANKHDIKIYEYTPLQVKNSVVGYGRAEKKQVQEMTRSILRLKEIPKPDDAADALALAITHGHYATSKVFGLN